MTVWQESDTDSKYGVGRFPGAKIHVVLCESPGYCPDSFEVFLDSPHNYGYHLLFVHCIS